MNLISREAVLALLAAHPAEQWALAFRAEIERLPYFPAPNPTGAYDRNVLGQTEDEFWDLVDREAIAKSSIDPNVTGNDAFWVGPNPPTASAASDPRGSDSFSLNSSARVEGSSLALAEPVARCP